MVPRHDDAAEDDGWLVSLGYDKATDRGELIVLPAADPGRRPGGAGRAAQPPPDGLPRQLGPRLTAQRARTGVDDRPELGPELIGEAELERRDADAQDIGAHRRPRARCRAAPRARRLSVRPPLVGGRKLAHRLPPHAPAHRRREDLDGRRPTVVGRAPRRAGRTARCTVARRAGPRRGGSRRSSRTSVSAEREPHRRSVCSQRRRATTHGSVGRWRIGGIALEHPVQLRGTTSNHVGGSSASALVEAPR